MKYSLFLFIVVFFSSIHLIGCEYSQSNDSQLLPSQQVKYNNVSSLTAEDSLNIQLFNKVMTYAEEKKLSDQPLGIIVQAVGEWFMDIPYVAGSLDENESERLVIKLDGFDCVTFVESTLALSRTIADKSYSFESFKKRLIEQRYRASTVDGYCSRLHYFSEWIYRNEEKGSVENITENLGGVRLEKTLNFMSTHRDSYPRLASSDSLFSELVDVENTLASLDLFYIPQSQISEVYHLLEEGDIIALATDINGLDVVHTGFVHKSESGATGLMHASTTKGVTVSPDLQDYVENNKRQIGIVVARPIR